MAVARGGDEVTAAYQEASRRARLQDVPGIGGRVIGGGWFCSFSRLTEFFLKMID